ncbi:MAG: type II toxin-antitoxin system prevent-host-death family antitoxin [Nocardioides sp.]|uniref:type II toxin-antitoxin system prevent-host-death family antitoxin n=1 Tax=Nocardioides sp. TaxID=35761 RepID=UPI0039E2C0B6
MAVTPTQLRADLFRLLDEVLETGEPLEVTRNGRTLRIVAEQPRGKLARVVPRPGYVVSEDSDEFLEPTPWDWDPEEALDPS